MPLHLIHAHTKSTTVSGRDSVISLREGRPGNPNLSRSKNIFYSPESPRYLWSSNSLIFFATSVVMLTAHLPVVSGWTMSGDLLHFQASANRNTLHLLKYLIPSPSPPFPPLFHLHHNIWWKSQIMKFTIVNLLQPSACLHPRMIRYLHSTWRCTQFEVNQPTARPTPRVVDRFLRVSLHVGVTIHHGFQVTLEYTGCSFYYATLITKPVHSTSEITLSTGQF